MASTPASAPGRGQRSPKVLLGLGLVLSVILFGGNRDGSLGPFVSAEESCNVTRGDTNCTPVVCNQEFCATHVRREAYLACLDFQGYNVDEKICRQWEDYAERECRWSCSNCTHLASTIYGQCVFYLGLSLPYSNAMQLCADSRSIFEHTRCPAAILDQAKCDTREALACGALCGNFYEAPGVSAKGCTCYRDYKRASRPGVCTGETVNSGLIPGTGGLEHSCVLTPTTCLTHTLGTTCSLYSHCPVNVCVVKNITCPYLGDCKSAGICGRSTGKCYYTSRKNGENCTDYLDYTWGDSCLDGQCIGNEDKCMKYGIVCETDNPCLVPRRLMTYTGVLSNCDTGSGGCMFTPVDDGLHCASIPGGQIDGRCEQGLCRKTVHDPCVNRVCPDLGYCFDVSRCDSFTGECVPVWKKDGYACDDGRGDTYDDKCIEGRCTGSPISEPKFQTLGSGDCIRHLPSASDTGSADARPVARYYKQALDAGFCEARCRWDPECIAYSYGYHTCSIYGSTRKTHPEGWTLDTTEAFIEHEVTCWMKTGDETWDFMAIVRPYLHDIALGFFVGTPVLFVVLWFIQGIRTTYRRSLGLQPSKSLLSNAAWDDEDWDVAEDVDHGDDVRDERFAEPDRGEGRSNHVSFRREEEATSAQVVAARSSQSLGQASVTPTSTARDPRGEVEEPETNAVNPALS